MEAKSKRKDTEREMGKPSVKRFIWGAALERRPVATEITKSVPSIGKDKTTDCRKRSELAAKT
jgi:hypothetical protein